MSYRNLGYIDLDRLNLFIGPGTGSDATDNGATRSVFVGELAGSGGIQPIDSVFLGYNARCTVGSNNGGTAIGSNARVGNATGGTAIGLNALANGVQSVCVGEGSTAGPNSTVIGGSNNITTDFTVSIGAGNTSTFNSENILIGGGVQSGNNRNVFIGYGGLGDTSQNAASSQSVAIGYAAGNGQRLRHSVVIGELTLDSSTAPVSPGFADSVVIGPNAGSNQDVQIFGQNTYVGHSVANQFGEGGSNESQYNTFIGDNTGGQLVGAPNKPFGQGNTVIGANIRMAL